MQTVDFKFTTMLTKEKCESLLRAAKQTANLDGEFWDIGCNSGGSSALMKFGAPRKTLRLFDSFQGLPEGSEKDLNDNPGRFKATHQEELWILGHVYEGWVPQTFFGLEDKKIALAHIDLDLYQGTKDALEFVIPRLVENGIIVVDDYGSNGWNGVKTAVDELTYDNLFRRIEAPEQITLTHRF